MASLEFVGLVFTGLSISISIIYYANVLRNANKAQQIQQETRDAQYFIQYTQLFHSPERLTQWVNFMKMEWTDFIDFEIKYGSGAHPEKFGDRYSYWQSLNDLGWLVEKGIVKVEDVNALVGQSLFWTWEKFEDIILKQREVYSLPDNMIYWEKLYNRVKEYRKDKGILEKVPEFLDNYLTTLKDNS